MKVPGMEFNEFPVAKHKPIRAQAFLDLSHCIGNIVVCVKDDFIQRFPRNFFKTVNLDSSVLFRQFGGGNGVVPDMKTVIYNSKPVLEISPKYDYNYVSEFYSSFFHDNVSPVDLKDDNIFMGCPYADHDLRISLKNTYCRIQMRFEFQMLFDTEAEMRNAYGYIIRHMPWDRHLPYLECTLENKIPREFIKQIAIDSGFIKPDEEFIKPEKMKAFIDYLNAHCPTRGMRFVQKYQNGTGNKEIFNAFEVDLLMYFDGAPSVDEGSLNGQVREGFGINMSLVVQSTVPSVYYYSTEHSHYSFVENLPISPDNPNNPVGAIYVNGDSLKIPITTIKYDYIPENFMIGESEFTRYTQCGYEIDEDIENEVIPIDELFDNRLKRIVKWYRDRNKDMDFYAILLFKDTVPLRGCSFDMNNFTLTVPSMYRASTYMIGLYIDLNRITDIENNILSRDIIKDGMEGEPSKPESGDEE